MLFTYILYVHLYIRICTYSVLISFYSLALMDTVLCKWYQKDSHTISLSSITELLSTDHLCLIGIL